MKPTLSLPNWNKHVVISSCANSLFQVTRNARELATGAMACDRPRESGNPVGNSAITHNVSQLCLVAEYEAINFQ